MFRRPKAVRSMVAIAAYLVVAGCSADAVAPPARGAMSALRSEDAGDAVVPNGVKYRDSGQRPATGRSGAAALTARALVDRAGTAELELTTGALDEAGAASLTTGTLTKVQVKGLTPDGTLLFTENYNGANAASASYSYGGLARGARLEVQTHVRTPGSSRVDVITLTETVKLRPDVAVGALLAPAYARLGTPVNIGATVREGNGDVGARADCVLYVDGAAADRAEGIWVDAGGVVTCAFAHTFAAAGVRRLDVRLEGVTPADYEPGNNGASASIEITTDPFRYSAFARDLDLFYHTYGSSRTTRLADGLTSETETSETKSGREQASGIYADMPTRLSFPLARVEVSQTSGGAVLHQAAYANLMPNSRGRCFQEQYAIFGYGKLFLCANPTSTVVQYVRWAGDVTYHSTLYAGTWDAEGAPVGTPVYSWNGRTERDGLMPPLGDDVTIRISIDDDGGLYNTVVAVPLQPYEYRVDWPLSCKEATNQQLTMAFRSCTRVLWLDTGRAGSAAGATH